MAVVIDGPKGRIYLSPTEELEKIPNAIDADWKPEITISGSSQYLGVKPYGVTKFSELFNERQLRALTTFSNLVHELQEKVTNDAKAAKFFDDNKGIGAGGCGAFAYGQAIAIYMGIAIDRCSDYWSNLCTWAPHGEYVTHVFGRQAIPMVWDYVEVNPFSRSTGNWHGATSWVSRVVERLPGTGYGHAHQVNASSQQLSTEKVISTDPPYYDNVPYADLSDFFYVWLRKALKNIYPTLFGTMAVPKSEELVAFAYRHNDKEGAEKFFLDGMTKAMQQLSSQCHPAFPSTIYYAFKQTDTTIEWTGNTGWEVFLDSVIRAGFSIQGTWPMRTEMANRMRGIGSNALATSVVLVCQKRSEQVETISRRQFQRQLREEMPEALEAMIGGSKGTSPIAPVDLAQAAIGPGMGIFSGYDSVLNQDGSAMSVHDALILINRSITDYLNPDTGNFDNDTLFCDSWFAEYGWSAGQFGQANTLAQAKGTTVDGVKDAGAIKSGQGKVRLLKWQEYPPYWDPKQDNRTPVWEALHHLIRAFKQHGESGAGALLSRMPERGESIRQLAYHLYTLCERKGWAEDARAYNELITAWHAIVAASHDVGHVGSQTELGI